MSEVFFGSDAGTYKAAKALYVSDAGEWIEVPLSGGGGPPSAPPWTRPTDWLPMNVNADDQKIQLLVRVGADATVEFPRAMTVTVSPAYTVDWGDGTAVENVATGVTAKHLYDPTSLAGTATSEGWLQALVTITPQTNPLLTLAIDQPYYAGKIWRSPVVEIVIGPSLSSISTSASSNYSMNLARVEFKAPFMGIDGTNMFSGCQALREVIGEIRLSGLTHTSMFSSNNMLGKYPTITFTNAGTTGNVSNMFNFNTLMTVIPVITGTQSVANWTSAFANCTRLKEVPASLNTSRGTNFTSMFQNCTSLTKVGAIDTSKGLTFNLMFQTCTKLKDVALLNTALGTSFVSMFSGCTSLVSVPTFNTVKGTTFASMFVGCTSLAQAPPFNYAAATTLTSMFNNCTSLSTVALDNPQTVTSVNNMFSGCSNMTEITGVNLAGPINGTNMNSFTAGCSRLTKIGVVPGKGPRFTVSNVLISNMMDAAAVNDFYTQLPTVSGQTLYVTAVPGGLGSDTSIATAKGWIVNVT